MKSAYLLPTGNEIHDGVVLDLDSPEIMRQIISRYPTAEVTRLCPLADTENEIMQKIKEIAEYHPDLIVLIGGSGGGHRHSPTLGKDYTHTALDRVLERKCVREIYGKNGHLWCRILCGTVGRSLAVNVPGPFHEAKAAMEALLKAFSEAPDIEMICGAMALAVYAQYPVREAEPL